LLYTRLSFCVNKYELIYQLSIERKIKQSKKTKKKKKHHPIMNNPYCQLCYSFSHGADGSCPGAMCTECNKAFAECACTWAAGRCVLACVAIQLGDADYATACRRYFLKPAMYTKMLLMGSEMPVWTVANNEESLVCSKDRPWECVYATAASDLIWPPGSQPKPAAAKVWRASQRSAILRDALKSAREAKRRADALQSDAEAAGDVLNSPRRSTRSGGQAGGARAARGADVARSARSGSAPNAAAAGAAQSAAARERK
jgi:hypothetical protein